MSFPTPHDITITVSGGTGTTTKTFHGELAKTFIDAPAGASYDYRVNNSAGKPAHMAPSLVDDVFDENAYPANGAMSFVISNSTIDGDFVVTVWYKAR